MVTLGLAACSDATGHVEATAGASRKTLKVGIAYDLGGRGDNSFNDAAAAGLEQVKADLDVQLKELEAEKGEGDDQRFARLKLLCDAGYDPIIAVGFVYAGDPKTGPLARAVQYCPKVKFAIVDDSTVVAPNLANLVFAEEEGSFLVGAAAALRSSTGRIGFVSGCDVPAMHKFQAGYQAGARAVRPKIRIDVNQLSTMAEGCSGFNEPAKAKLVATRMYEAGADVVFQAAGGSGRGVFEAAKAGRRWAIGVDTDQYNTVSPQLRDVIITSMIKRVDVAVFSFVEQVADGEFRAGVTRFDLKAGGVGYTLSGGRINDLDPQLQALKREISSGRIRVPSTL